MTQPFPPPSRLHSGIKSLLVIGLAAIATLIIAPTLFGGQLPWLKPLPVPHLQELRALRKAALPLPGWKVTSHEVITLNGHDWTVSEYEAETSQTAKPTVNHMVILLRPQPAEQDQPTLEWTDLAGAQQWKVDSRRSRTFTTEASSNPFRVRAQFLRSWNQKQTFAALQWYAWPNGGDAFSNHWFWADQLTQWRSHHHLPWVAVSVLLPIAPLGDIGPYEPLATSVGQAIQTHLEQGPFAARP